MIIGLGSDHGGYLLKEDIKKYLQSLSIDYIDYGCNSLDSCDYPLYAQNVCRAILSGEANVGILVCTTGIGMSISANRFCGIRAALVTNDDMCALTRKHNNSNVLCLGSKYVSFDQVKNFINIFLNTSFEGECSEGARHLRRVEMIERNK